MEEGWIKLSRKLLQNELWKEPREFSKAEAWIDLLLSAEWQGEHMGIVRQSLAQLSQKWGWSRTNTHRFLKSLVVKNQLVPATYRVGTKVEHQVEHYSIANFEYYQGFKKPRSVSLEHQMKQKRNTSDIRSLCTNSLKKKEEVPPTPLTEEGEDEPLTVQFPTELDTYECRKTWGDFVSHRRRIKKPFKTIEAQNFALKRAAKHGPSAFVAAIEEAIAAEWQGFFPEKHTTDANGTPRVFRDSADRAAEREAETRRKALETQERFDRIKREAKEKRERESAARRAQR